MLVIGTNRVDMFIARRLRFLTKAWVWLTGYSNIELAKGLFVISVVMLLGSMLKGLARGNPFEAPILLLWTWLLWSKWRRYVPAAERAVEAMTEGFIDFPPALIRGIAWDRMFWGALGLFMFLLDLSEGGSVLFEGGLVVLSLSLYVLLHIAPPGRSAFSRAKAWLKSRVRVPVLVPAPTA